MDKNLPNVEIKSNSSQDVNEIISESIQPNEFLKSKKKKKLVIIIGLASVLSMLFIGLFVAVFFWYRNRDFNISPNMIEMESDGGVVRIMVEGPNNWKILNTPKSWVYLAQDGKYLVCTVNENLGFERGDTIKIGNDYKYCSFVVKQESGAFVATPTNINASANSGEYTFYISGRTNWIIDDGPAGWGSATKIGNKLQWRVTENYGSERSDMITLRSGDKILCIGLVQCGALKASESSLNEGSSAHTKHITISGPDNWDVRSDSYWMDVTRDGNRVKIIFEKNDDDYEREGYIKINGGNQEIQIPVTQQKRTTSSSGNWGPYWNVWY